jgi:archaeal flagellin FlaB
MINCSVNFIKKMRLNNMKKKADMGIGTLIIFIAMMLVASGVAYVFYQTATSLQNKALNVAESSRKSISTRLDFVHISGETFENKIEHLYADVRLSPSSDPINLENSILMFSLSDISINLHYSNNSCKNVSSFNEDGFFTDMENKNGTFSVEYISVSNSHSPGYLQRGEFLKICFSSPYPIQNDKQFELKFVSLNGNPTTVKVFTPYIITTKFVKLYP